MHLTLKSDYALRLIMTAPPPTGEPRSLADIAETLSVSRNHLHKVAQELTSIGVLESIAGRSGGIRLKEKALALTVGDVVRRTEPLGAVTCLQDKPSQDACVLDRGCTLKNLLRDAEQAFLRELDSVSLGALVQDNREVLVMLGLGPSS